MSTYAIISVGGKQYRVCEGQRLLVDRLPHPEAATFHPRVLFVGGEGKADLSPQDTQVTATVVRNVLGDKIRIGKYKPKTGYRRHRGYRSRLTEIEITAVGDKALAEARAGRRQGSRPSARAKGSEKSERGSTKRQPKEAKEA